MKKVIYLIYVMTITLVLNSCSNFLAGSDLKAELDEAITYAKAEPFTILFTSKKGDITPNGNVQCKETQQISAYFSAGDDYYFKNWQVSMNNVVLTKEQAAEYVKIYDYEKPETTIKILKKVDNLRIDANCGDRPAILEGFPRYESSGVNRDSRITVMFSRVMDKASIYFSEEELKSLSIISKAESLEALIDEAVTESKDHVKSKTGSEIIVDVKNKTCYGYQINPADNQTIVFKNIEIYKRTSQENLLCCYKAPYFDEADGSILRIDAKNGETEAPTAYTEIVVKVLQDMCIKENNGQVSLVKQHYWPYLTNTKTDDVPPQVKSFKVMLKEEGKDDVLLPTSKINSAPATNIPLYNLRDKKLWVMGEIYDEDSGPDTVSWTITSVSSNYYAENKKTESGYVQGFVCSGNTAFFGSGNGSNGGCEIDLSQLENSQGTYELSFTAYDKVGKNVSAGTYYFIYDDVPPEKPKLYYSYSKGKKIYFTYIAGGKDFVKTEFMNTNTGSVSANSVSANKVSTGGVSAPYNLYLISINDLSNNTENDLSNNTDYTFNVKNEDYAGNVSEKVEIKAKTGVTEGQEVYFEKSVGPFTNYKVYRSIDSRECIAAYNFNNDTTTVGFVYDISDLSNVKVIYKTNLYIEGKIADLMPRGLNIITSDTNGLETYSKFKDSENKGKLYESLVSMNSDNFGGKITWYLPSKNEMIKMIEKSSVINTNPGSDNKLYVTSTITSEGKGLIYTCVKNSKVQTGTAASFINTNGFYYQPIAQINMN